MKSLHQRNSIPRFFRTALGFGTVCLLLLAASSSPAQQPKPTHTLAAGSVPFCLVFSPDGRTLASAGEGEKWGPAKLKLWDVATGKNTATLKGHTAMVFSMAFSPDGKTLASVGGRFSDETGLDSNPGVGELRLWDVATGKTVATFPVGEAIVTSVAFSPNGKTLASASQAGTVDVWEVATGKKTISFETSSPPYLGLHSLAFSPDAKTLATGGGHARRPDGGLTGQVELWDLATGKRTATLHGHPGQGCFSNMFALALSVAFSPDGKTLASAGAQTVELWDVATEKNLITLQGVGVHVVWHVAFSPDGKTIASVNEVSRLDSDVKHPTEREIRLLDVSTGRQLASRKGDALSPDGKTLASTEDNGTIKLWDFAGFRTEKTEPSTPRNHRVESPPMLLRGPRHDP